MDATRGVRFFTKPDLAMAYMLFRIRAEDQFKKSLGVSGGQYEFLVGAVSLQGMSSEPMCYIHNIVGRPSLVFDASGPVSARLVLLGPANASAGARIDPRKVAAEAK